MHSSRKRAASLPPLKKENESYIQRTIDLMQSDVQEGEHLQIDGSFGDYRMRLFRRKDKNAYKNAIHSVFTQTFTKSLMPAHNPDIHATLTDIIESRRHREEHER